MRAAVAAIALLAAACPAPVIAPVAPGPSGPCGADGCGAAVTPAAPAPVDGPGGEGDDVDDDHELVWIDDPSEHLEDPVNTGSVDKDDTACLSNRGACTGAATAPPPPVDPVVAIGFAAGRAALDGAARQVLDAAAERLRSRPELALVEVAGSVDGRERSRGLAESRAAAVAAYLVARGIAPERLVVTRDPAPGRRVALTVRLAVGP